MRLEGNDGQNTLQYLILENSVTKVAGWYLKQIHIKVIYKIISEDAMFNQEEHKLLYNIWLLHVIQVTRPHILQRWIEATIYNDESSKYGSNVIEHNKILRNLGYRGEDKVFVIIQSNQYNPYHMNRCAEVKHGRNSTECQWMSDVDNWSKGVHQ